MNTQTLMKLNFTKKELLQVLKDCLKHLLSHISKPTTDLMMNYISHDATGRYDRRKLKISKKTPKSAQ